MDGRATYVQSGPNDASFFDVIILILLDDKARWLLNGRSRAASGKRPAGIMTGLRL
jgi:hypothetical protein